MATVRTHRYNVDTGNLAAMLESRTNLINGIRSGNPAFSSATLIRLDDNSYLDIWRWDSAEEMQRAAEAAKEFPIVGSTLAMTTDHMITDGEILDER